MPSAAVADALPVYFGVEQGATISCDLVPGGAWPCVAALGVEDVVQEADIGRSGVLVLVLGFEVVALAMVAAPSGQATPRPCRKACACACA